MKPSAPATPRMIGAINDRTALRLLLERGPLTRPEIGELTGLSKPTAFQILARLQEAGLVVNDGVRSGLPGRVAEVYRINPAAAYVAAVDVVPDQIEVRIADITGTVVGAHVHPTKPVTGALVDRLRVAVEGAGAPGPLSHIVIGVQGAVDPTTGLLGYATEEDMPGWRIPDLISTLTEALDAPVDVENDVNLVALAEQFHGTAADYPDFVLLWADEGLGAALVINGRLHRGHFGGAGEVGYMPTAGTATARDGGRYADHGYQSLAGGHAVQDLLATYGIQAAGFREAMASAVRLATGPPSRAAQDATAALRVVAARIATGLASISSVVDPGLIVLAGGLVTAGGEYLRDLIERELHALIHARPQVRLSTQSGNPVLAGALQLSLSKVRDDLLGPGR